MMQIFQRKVQLTKVETLNFKKESLQLSQLNLSKTNASLCKNTKLRGGGSGLSCSCSSETSDTLVKLPKTFFQDLLIHTKIIKEFPNQQTSEESIVKNSIDWFICNQNEFYLIYFTELKLNQIISCIDDLLSTLSNYNKDLPHWCEQVQTVINILLRVLFTRTILNNQIQNIQNLQEWKTRIEKFDVDVQFTPNFNQFQRFGIEFNNKMIQVMISHLLWNNNNQEFQRIENLIKTYQVENRLQKLLDQGTEIFQSIVFSKQDLFERYYYFEYLKLTLIDEIIKQKCIHSNLITSLQIWIKRYLYDQDDVINQYLWIKLMVEFLHYRQINNSDQVKLMKKQGSKSFQKLELFQNQIQNEDQTNQQSERVNLQKFIEEIIAPKEQYSNLKYFTETLMTSPNRQNGIKIDFIIDKLLERLTNFSENASNFQKIFKNEQIQEIKIIIMEIILLLNELYIQIKLIQYKLNYVWLYIISPQNTHTNYKQFFDDYKYRVEKYLENFEIKHQNFYLSCFKLFNLIDEPQQNESNKLQYQQIISNLNEIINPANQIQEFTKQEKRVFTQIQNLLIQDNEQWVDQNEFQQFFQDFSLNENTESIIKSIIQYFYQVYENIRYEEYDQNLSKGGVVIFSLNLVINQLFILKKRLTKKSIAKSVKQNITFEQINYDQQINDYEQFRDEIKEAFNNQIGSQDLKAFIEKMKDSLDLIIEIKLIGKSDQMEVQGSQDNIKNYLTNVIEQNFDESQKKYYEQDIMKEIDKIIQIIDKEKITKYYDDQYTEIQKQIGEQINRIQQLLNLVEQFYDNQKKCRDQNFQTPNRNKPEHLQISIQLLQQIHASFTCYLRELEEQAFSSRLRIKMDDYLQNQREKFKSKLIYEFLDEITKFELTKDDIILLCKNDQCHQNVFTKFDKLINIPFCLKNQYLLYLLNAVNYIQEEQVLGFIQQITFHYWTQGDATDILCIEEVITIQKRLFNSPEILEKLITEQLEINIQQRNECIQKIQQIKEKGEEIRDEDFQKFQKAQSKVDNFKKQIELMLCSLKLQLFEKLFVIDYQFNLKKDRVISRIEKSNYETVYVEVDDLESNLDQFMNFNKIFLFISGVAYVGKTQAAHQIEYFIWKKYPNWIPLIGQINNSKEVSVQSLIDTTLKSDPYKFTEELINKFVQELKNFDRNCVLILDSTSETYSQELNFGLYRFEKVQDILQEKNIIFPRVKIIILTRSELLGTNYQKWIKEEKNSTQLKLGIFKDGQYIKYLKQYTKIQFYKKLNIYSNQELFKISWIKLVEKQDSRQSFQLFNQDDLQVIIKELEISSDETQMKLLDLWSQRKFNKIIEIFGLKPLTFTPYLIDYILKALDKLIENFNKQQKSILEKKYENIRRLQLNSLQKKPIQQQNELNQIKIKSEKEQINQYALFSIQNFMNLEEIVTIKKQQFSDQNIIEALKLTINNLQIIKYDTLEQLISFIMNDNTNKISQLQKISFDIILNRRKTFQIDYLIIKGIFGYQFIDNAFQNFFIVKSILEIIKQVDENEFNNEISRSNFNETIGKSDLNDKSLHLDQEKFKDALKILKQKFENLNRQEQEQIKKKLIILIKLSAFFPNLKNASSNSIVIFSLISNNLSKQNLSKIKLQGVNLQGMNFNQCNLDESQFFNVDINNCTFLASSLLKVKWNFEPFQNQLTVPKFRQFNSIQMVAFCPISSILLQKSCILAFSDGYEVVIWDCERCEKIQTFQIEKSEQIINLSFSFNGQYLVLGQYNSITIWAKINQTYEQDEYVFLQKEQASKIKQIGFSNTQELFAVLCEISLTIQFWKKKEYKFSVGDEIVAFYDEYFNVYKYQYQIQKGEWQINDQFQMDSIQCFEFQQDNSILIIKNGQIYENEEFLNQELGLQSWKEIIQKDNLIFIQSENEIRILNSNKIQINNIMVDSNKKITSMSFQSKHKYLAFANGVIQIYKMNQTQIFEYYYSLPYSNQPIFQGCKFDDQNQKLKEFIERGAIPQ